MEFHPVANIFPLMMDDEFSALVQDIAEQGQLEPILIHDGKIVDGRNRYRACQKLGLDPITQTWKQSGSLIKFIVSKNLHRRHLSSSQRAVIALDILPMLEAEAHERKRIGAENRHNNSQDVEQVPHPGRESGKARDAVAKITGTNPRYEDYCLDRWGMSRIHAHRMIEAATVTGNLLPIGNIMPALKSQARPWWARWFSQ